MIATEDATKEVGSDVLGERSAGVLLHITSLPGDEAQGTLSQEALHFIDFLSDAGFGAWQILPMVPTHGDLSPYNGISSFAGNPNLLDFHELVSRGWLSSLPSACDNTLKSQLRDAGFTVRFRMTPAMRAAAESTVNENVSLIRSIGEQHLGQVEQLVMRSISEGRDLGYLTEQLTKRYGITRRRAANIARGQNNAATTAMRRVRELELGLEEGEWLHSGGGKEPRPPHVAFSRKRFKLADSHDFKDGNGKVMPGQLPGCRCTWGAVIPGFDD